jgi:peptidoglycan/LPS O-acetylase OafA/YrhL
MIPTRSPRPTSPNWTALLSAILLVAPFVRALWQAMQATDGTWLRANGDLLLFGAIIGAVLIGDSLRGGRPTRAFLLALAACLAAIGTGSAVFAIGVQFDVAEAREIGSLTVAGPLLALACAFGARLCLKRAFPQDIRR